MTSPEITTNEIFAQDTLSSTHSISNITELFNELVISKSSPVSKYEWYDSNNLKFMKIVVDIDTKTENSMKDLKKKYNDGDVIEKTTNVLKKLFGDDINVIYTTDHRRFIKNGEKKPKCKNSYHLIVDNKKINPLLLGRIMRKYKDKFIYPIDCSIYPRNKGEKKFRLPLTIKETEKRTSKTKPFMKMSLPETADNFKKYCITKTYGLDEVVPLVQAKEEIIEIEEKKEDVKDVKSLWDSYKLNYTKYNKILKKYKHGEVDKKTNTWVCDIECDCPFGKKHSTNRRYLTLNFLTNSIYIKCHSNRCEDEIFMVLDNVFNPLKEFNLSIFMRLENYKYQKKYLQKRVIYLSDTHKYKQIKYDKHNNKFLEDICYLPICNTESIYFDKGGEEKQSLFGKLYSGDKYKQIYKNTNFYPNKKDEDKNYYNEFQGFAYEKILPYDVNKKDVLHRQEANLTFYLDFLKKYVCNDDKKVLDYFLCLLSYYLKYPHLLNHIILVLYSNEQGTGKSSFLDFFMLIIGITYGANTEIEQVLDKHSNLSYKKLINVIEELEYESGKNYSKKLKNRCQAETTTLNEKNEPMRTIANFVHYIITTNEYRSIPLEPNDRRHFILEFKKIYNNDNLVNKVDDLYSNDEFIYTFGNFLRNLKEPFDYHRIILWEKKRPTTELFRIMIRRDGIETYFTKMINYQYHSDKNINCEEYYDYYVKSKISDFVLDGKRILIKKNELYDSYVNRCNTDKKFLVDSFNVNITDIKKFAKEVEYKEEKYYELDMDKIKNHLKLNDKEMRLLDMLIIDRDDTLPMKIKIKEMNDILKR